MIQGNRVDFSMFTNCLDVVSSECLEITHPSTEVAPKKGTIHKTDHEMYPQIMRKEVEADFVFVKAAINH